MAVDDVRARVRNELVEVASVETADYLLDRPPGGWGNLATKQDLADLEVRLDRRFTETDRRFTDHRTMFDAKLGELRAELRGEIGGVRGEIGEMRAELRGEIGSLGSTLTSQIDERFAHQMRWFTTTMLGSMTGVFVAVVALIKI